MNFLQKILVRIAIFLIRAYRLTLSPIIGQSCRFVPTCSHYTEEAILKYGIVKGTLLGVKRIIRCNPFTKGGYDPLN